MLRVVSVGQQLRRGVRARLCLSCGSSRGRGRSTGSSGSGSSIRSAQVRAGAGVQQPERQRRALSPDRRVRIQQAPQLVRGRRVGGSEGRGAQPEGGPVLDGLRDRTPQGAEQERRVGRRRHRAAAQQPQGEKGPSLGERRGARAATASRQVRCHQRPAGADVPAVDHAQTGRRGEFGPVGRAGEPVEVVAQEAIDGGSSVRGGVGEDDLRRGSGVLKEKRRRRGKIEKKKVSCFRRRSRRERRRRNKKE